LLRREILKICKRSIEMREPQWRQEGEEPDYRFSLANERTFLAWISTALALLVGADVKSTKSASRQLTI
jgi:uncharacterized membrane protein YidH (DUF202 family)